MTKSNSMKEHQASLSRPSHMTLTDACAETLRQAIVDGTFLPGSQLPPEKELVSELGVSRTTLREALRTLEQQNLIVRRRGVGTFVAESPMTKDLSVNFGITRMIRQAGYTPKEGARQISREAPSADLISTFPSLSREDSVTIVDRIRLANERPVVRSLDVVPLSVCAESKLLEFGENTSSLYEFLANKVGVYVVRGVTELCPTIATKEIAAALEVRRGSPILRINQTDYDASDREVLHSIEYHVPDAFVFLVNRTGPYLRSHS